MDLGLYIHIPFCRKKCDYCGFYSIPLQDYSGIDINYRNKEIDEYIKILISELIQRSPELINHSVDTIYLGGGTPSLLNPAQLEAIIDVIYKNYKLCDEGLEFTIECNPDDFSVQRIKEYNKSGINRVVLGVQTTNSRLHSAIGRSADLCDVKMLSDFAGIQDVVHCIDMIAGIPGQTENDLEAELSRIASFRFEHISAYTLSIEAGTPLAKRQMHSLYMNDMQRALLEQVIHFFTDAGYEHYEVSNYALPSYQSRHNMKYWKFLPYAGFGPAAHSFYNGKRYFNINSLDEYIKSGGDTRQDDKRIKNSEIVEFILSGMRLNSGISIKDLENKLNIKIPDSLIAVCKEMNKDGLIRIVETGDDLSVNFTRKGFFLMDSCIYKMTEMFL